MSGRRKERHAQHTHLCAAPRSNALSLVVASCVTPTDPILAQAVVGGPWAEKHVPTHLRHMLMCESGCNDGAAFPFLYLALFLTVNRDNHGKAIAEWVSAGPMGKVGRSSL